MGVNDAKTLIDRSIREKIVLVGVAIPPGTTEDAEESLDELALLVDTAGADAVERLVQRRSEPDPATYVGKGKAEEILEASLTVDADTVVFDNELSPAQQRNLEKILGRSALDRTAVILDIFAQHAQSQAGKAQVELAQLRYRLPRLRGRGLALSQQGAGIGTRGPGETQLEVDRRRLLRRMTKLEAELKDLRRNRQTQRRARSRSRFANVALVGYTNAGKSTLLNAITHADVLVEDRLFSTLDPTTRRAQLPGGETVLFSDTVGFVRKLPHQLVEAFRSTLEEVAEADLLIHVVDASSVDPDAQIAAVRTVLAEIGAAELPELLVFNKADRAGDRGKRLVETHHGSVLVSARTRAGFDEFYGVLGDRLRALSRIVDLIVPFDRGDVLAALHREGEVLVEEAGDTGMRIQARLDDAGAARFRDFQTA